MTGTPLRKRTFERLNQAISKKSMKQHAAIHYYTYPFYQKATGVSLDSYFHDPKTMFATQAKVLEQLEWCGNFSPDTGAVAECSALGGTVQFDKEGFISVRAANVDSIDELLHLLPGNPYGNNYMHVALDALEYMCRYAPDGIGVNPPFVNAPFSVAAQLRGISDFCMDTIENEDAVDALLKITTQTVINYIAEIKNILRRPIHHILLADDLSAFLSESAFYRFVKPCYKRLFEAYPEIKFWLHNDASANHIAHAISEMGFWAWQYAPDVDPNELLQKTDAQLPLIGGLNPLQMQDMSPQDIYNYSIDTMTSFKGNSLLILSAGGAINQVSVEGALSVLHAADDYYIATQQEFANE